MKTFVTIALFFTCFLTATSVAAQEGSVAVVPTTTTQGSLESTVEVVADAQMSDWFSGQVAPSQTASGKVSTTRSLVPSKKEMYLQSGCSNSTLLIRSILKKADAYLNGMA
jgi:hypothetical protein